MQNIKAKGLMCPQCGKRKLLIEDEEESCDIQLELYKPEQGAKWFLKCPVCKQQVGIKINHKKTG